MQYIKEFIETCPYLNNGKVNADYLKEKEYSYSIDRTPIDPIYKRYSDGGTVKQISFDFCITMPLGTKAVENLVNSKFCDDFMSWIETQNNNRNLPKIPGVRSIECTSPGYLLNKTKAVAIYIIQMNCKYYENYRR